jgi:hypothetical protein
VELQTVVDEVPSRDTGDMVPVVLPRMDVEIVPNAVAGMIVVDDIVVLEGVIVAVMPAMDVETVLGTIDGVGTALAVTAD